MLNGRMMDMPLLISSIIDYAADVRSSSEIVSQTVEGNITLDVPLSLNFRNLYIEEEILFNIEDNEVSPNIKSQFIKLFKPITPSFIIGPLVPLYVAWFFYMIRFYLMPWILGYSVMGMLSFPLESEISRQIYQFFNSF